MGDIPDFGDLAGLTRIYWLCVQRIRASVLPDEGMALILTEIEAQFRAARAAAASNRAPVLAFQDNEIQLTGDGVRGVMQCQVSSILIIPRIC